MEQLDISEGFDVHEYRHGLKLVRETRKTIHLESREDRFACPACGEPFGKLFVSENPTATFGDPGRPFCVARTDERLLVLTH